MSIELVEELDFYYLLLLQQALFLSSFSSGFKIRQET